MRYTILLLFVFALCCVSFASPAKEKNNNKKAFSCSKDCGGAYEPLCAKAKNSSKERLLTFGSDCVMSNYNCAHADDQFEFKSKGECGGNVSVRLA